MTNFFGNLGHRDLSQAKSKSVDHLIIKSEDAEFVINHMTNKWGENNFRVYTFTNYNKNETFTEITTNEE
jgi:hypothetical protein